MARKYLTPIDLTGLELQNFKVQNLSSNPSAYGKGHTYYNTTANELRTYNGTSWETVGGNVISGATGARPAAGHAGRLFFDTTLNVIFFDNGTAWVQDGVSQSDLTSAISGAALGSTDNLSEGTTNLYFTTQRARDAIGDIVTGDFSYNGSALGLNFSSVESQLVTDGFAKTSDIPSLSGYVTETGVETLSNKTFSGDTYFQSSGGAGGTNNYLSVDNGTGKFTVRSGYALDLSASGDINIVSNNGDIVINPDGSAYIGSVTANNRIATISDLNAELYIVSVSSPLAVDGSGNLTVDLTSYLTTSDASSTYLTQSDASSTYLSQSTASSTYLSQSDASTTYATQSSLSSYLTTSDASSTYLTQSDASSNYLTQSTASSTYLTQSDASTTYQTTSGLDTAISGLGYITGTGQYIQSVGSNLSVSGTELDISGTPEFTSINLTSNGSGTNITVGDDAYIGDVNVSNNIGIKGQEDATKGGIVFGSAKTESISSDGTNLTLAADNDIILNPGSTYAYIGSVTDAHRIATRSYVDGVAQGLNVKNSVAAATTANIALDGSVSTLDGHTVVTGDRILVKNQSTASQNGIYVASTTDAWTRATDEQTPAKGDFVFVESGTANGKTGWILSDTTGGNYTWTQFSAAGEYTAGNGIDISGNSIAVKHGAGLTFSGSDLVANVGGGLYTDTYTGAISVNAGTGITITGGSEVALDTDNGYGVRKYAATIGDGSATSYDVTHNFGTRDVEVTVYDAATYEEVIVDITRTSTTKVTIGFAVAPSANSYRVVVVG